MWLGLVLMAAIVAGLFRTGKARECLTFSTYVTLATVFLTLILLWPSHYGPEEYMVKQGIYDSLLLGMAIELSVKVFAAFRGVARRVRALLALAVIASTSAIFILTPSGVSYAEMLPYQAGITTAGVWCLSFVALLIVWYQIPVPAFTRAILLGYVPYAVVFVIYADLIGRLGWGAIDGLNVLNAAAYDTVAAYWAFTAWRKG